ncbi:MAG: FliH/SctL family protein [Desulfitobacteriaceae bacterium]
MNLSIRQRVVKSYAVAVAGPRLVDCQFTEFKGLTEHLTVLTAAEEESIDAAHEGEVLEEVDRILQQAQAQAAGVIRYAEAQAQAILQAAERDLARRREELEAAVRLEIYPQARAEGYQVGLREGEREAEKLQEKAKAIVKLMQQALQNEYAKVNQELLGLSLRIAERVVRVSLKMEPKLLLEIARSLTLLPQEREGWVLHIAPQDAAWLADQPSDVLPCPWIKDDTLKSGDCFLECQEGIFDARLANQLAKFEQVLQEEMKHGGLEPLDTPGREN